MHYDRYSYLTVSEDNLAINTCFLSSRTLGAHESQCICKHSAIIQLETAQGSIIGFLSF